MRDARKTREDTELLEKPVREARRLQDHPLRAISGVIRNVNAQVGASALPLLAEAGGRQGVRSDASTD